MQVSVNPVIPVARERKSRESPEERKPIDSKVKGVVLERISSTKGALLSSTATSQVVIDLRPVVESSKRDQGRKPKKKAKVRKTPVPRVAPIGLRAVDPEGGVNALMQFLLFVPGAPECFCFAPRSFALFQEFIDQYYQDQIDNRSPSGANGMAIFRFLGAKVPDLSLHDIFEFVLGALNPKWALKMNLEQALEKGNPTDLFVMESSHKKQLFVSEDLGYELDAFIELRPDGVSAHFVAYVKVNGVWYQCDDERITGIRSHSLPLNRAILLHYKRIAFGQSGWV